MPVGGWSRESRAPVWVHCRSVTFLSLAPEAEGFPGLVAAAMSHVGYITGTTASACCGSTTTPVLRPRTGRGAVSQVFSLEPVSNFGNGGAGLMVNKAYSQNLFTCAAGGEEAGHRGQSGVASSNGCTKYTGS